MFKGGTTLSKVKAILLPAKLKASPGRQGAKGIPRKRSNPSQIWGIQEVLLHGFVSFLKKVKGIFFMDPIVKRWSRVD